MLTIAVELRGGGGIFPNSGLGLAVSRRVGQFLVCLPWPSL